MLPGSVVADRFEIQAAIRKGGMSTVYRALDRSTGAPVALKLLGDKYGDEAERFLREGIALELLRHPGIVRYVAHGASDSAHYLAMEWLEGEDLAARLERGPLTIAESVSLATRVCSALASAHGAGLVHRDIKPSNLFLPDKRVDRVKVIDFGIARFADRTELTGPGIIFGTLGYMAPEQARGERRIDARADVFSLGCVLFECIIGRQVFTGAHPTAVLAKVVLEDAPRLRTLRADVPEALDRLVVRMLSKVPSSRPADARALAAEIEEIARLPIASASSNANGPSSVTTGKMESLTADEQRLVSVVMAAAGELASPDATMAIPLGPGGAPSSVDDLRAAVAPFGAHLEYLRNGSLIATLVGRGNASDQAARAARCALALRAGLDDAPIVLAMGRGVLGARIPVGDVIDHAVEMLRAAAPQDKRGPARPVAVDAMTAALLDARFDVARTDDAFRLRAEREPEESTRTLLGKPTPCVGRERELSLLNVFLRDAVSERTVRAVLVTAAAGIGKSRLRQELLRSLRESPTASLAINPPEVWTARGDPMSAGSPFGLVAQIVRRAVGVREGEPLEERRSKLRARVAQSVPGKRALRVTHFLGELIGARFDGEESVQLRAARQDAMLMGDQMRAAWEDFLDAECALRPVVLVIEDLHWGDLPSVQFIDSLLRNVRDRPLFVLALARPEVHDLFPELWAGRGVQEIRLSELSKKASEKLVLDVLGRAVDDATLQRLVDRAAGNAFYLEELIRAVSERKGDELPETVVASVQARLERLEPDARRLLRAASVFGQVFWRSGVTSLLGGAEEATRSEDWLRELVDREVITRRAVGKFPEEDEYFFHHSLVREAAYAMLTDGDRRLGHLLAGNWLERVGESDPMTLAEHLERGGEPARAMGFYRRAAEHALEGNDFDAVVARAERGIACGATGEVLGALRVLETEAHRWRGDLAGAEACSLDAMRLLVRCSPLWFNAVGELALASGRRGKSAQLVMLGQMLHDLGKSRPITGPHAIASARAATQLLLSGKQELGERIVAQIDAIDSPGSPGAMDGTEQSDNPAVTARINVARYYRAICAGDVGAGAEFAKAAAERFEQVGDLRSACNQKGEIAYTQVELGAYAQARETFREVLATAERLGRLRYPVMVAKHNLGIALARLGALDEANAIETEALLDFKARGDRRMEGRSRIFLAEILLLGGDLEAADREAHAAVKMLSVAPPARAHALAMTAQVSLARGRNEEALGDAQRADQLLQELGVLDEGESLVRLVHAEALHACGNHEAAAAAIAVARERLLARAMRIRDEALRASFLERIPENARTLELARAWTSQGGAS